MIGDAILVRKLGYDGREIFHWTGRLVGKDAEGVVVEAPFNVEPVDLGYVVLERGDLFVEFYYRARWFNVFQVYARDGRLKGWYCNLSTPIQEEAGELRYADLALDLFVRPDGTWVEDDREEYEQLKRHAYRPEDVAAAEAGLAELLGWVRAGHMPGRPFPAPG